MQRRIVPPEAWRSPDDHWRVVLSHPWYQHIVQLTDTLLGFGHEFFRGRGQVCLSVPTTTGSISSPMGNGSDSLPVSVEMSGIQTYLADSMQFLLEYGCRLHDAGAYYIMSCFRGEPLDSSHLAQFCHVECEIPGTLDNIVSLSGEFVVGLAERLATEHGDQICALAGTMKHVEALIENSIESIQYRDVIEMLRDVPGALDEHEPPRITRPGERWLIERLGGAAEAVWLTNFDEMIVPFYQARDEGGTSRTADLLLGGREVIGAGERHGTLDEVRDALLRHEVDLAPYAWYAEMKDLVPLKTAGMGMGVERFLMWLTRQSEIRDFPIVYRENGRSVVP